MLKLRIPATSANIGPGFDSIGLAVGLYNYVTLEEYDGACHRIARRQGDSHRRDEPRLYDRQTALRAVRRALPGAQNRPDQQYPADARAGLQFRLRDRRAQGREPPDGEPRLGRRAAEPRRRDRGASRQLHPRADRRACHRCLRRKKGVVRQAGDQKRPALCRDHPRF